MRPKSVDKPSVFNKSLSVALKSATYPSPKTIRPSTHLAHRATAHHGTGHSSQTSYQSAKWTNDRALSRVDGEDRCSPAGSAGAARSNAIATIPVHTVSATRRSVSSQHTHHPQLLLRVSLTPRGQSPGLNLHHGLVFQSVPVQTHLLRRCLLPTLAVVVSLLFLGLPHGDLQSGPALADPLSVTHLAHLSRPKTLQ